MNKFPRFKVEVRRDCGAPQAYEIVDTHTLGLRPATYDIVAVCKHKADADSIASLLNKSVGEA